MQLKPSNAAQALVIVPTYNERESIGEIVRRLFEAAGHAVDLLVVDDGSPDGTAALVRELAQGPHEIHVWERASKQGLASAYVGGFKAALAAGYAAVVEMDADLSHNPEDVPRLLEALSDGADLAIGSRYVPQGAVVNWSWFRKALSAAGNLYARLWLGYRVTDSTSGFRAYRTDALREENLDTIRSEGYAFQIEMTRRIHRRGGRIVEIPITFTERAAGRSKMTRRIVIEALVMVTAWGLDDRLRGRSRRR